MECLGSGQQPRHFDGWPPVRESLTHEKAPYKKEINEERENDLVICSFEPQQSLIVEPVLHKNLHANVTELERGMPMKGRGHSLRDGQKLQVLVLGWVCGHLSNLPSQLGGDRPCLCDL